MGLNTHTTNIAGVDSSLSIVGGKFTLRVSEGTDGAVSRKLTKGKNEGMEVWELKYPSISGLFISGAITSGEYPGVDITIGDDLESYTINFPLDSRYLYSFIKALPNVDTSREITIEILEGKRKTRQGNPTYYLRVVQDGKVVPDYYTEWKKDASGKNIPVMLHGMPEAEDTPRGISFMRQENWLLERLKEFLSDEPVAAEPEDDSVPF